MSRLSGRLREFPTTIVISVISKNLLFWKGGHLQEVVAQGGSTENFIPSELPTETSRVLVVRVLHVHKKLMSFVFGNFVVPSP